MPSARRTALRSDLWTGCSFSYVRLRFCDLCSSRWLFHDAARMSFPPPDTRMRFAMPLRVLILGTGRGLLRGRLTGRREDHEEVLAFQQRLALDHRELARVVRDPVEDPAPDLLVDHLSAPEHDRHLYLLACFEELSQTFELGLEIVLRHLGSKLHLLQLDDVLLAALVLLALDGLELVSSVIHQPADRRLRLRRHLYEVKPFLACNAQRCVQRLHAKLVVLVVDQPHFGAADLIVDP